MHAARPTTRCAPLSCRCGVRLAKLHALLTGLPSLLDPAACGQRPMWINPAYDQQRMDNMERVMERLRAVGILPDPGQVRVCMFVCVTSCICSCSLRLPALMRAAAYSACVLCGRLAPKGMSPNCELSLVTSGMAWLWACDAGMARIWACDASMARLWACDAGMARIWACDAGWLLGALAIWGTPQPVGRSLRMFCSGWLLVAMAAVRCVCCVVHAFMPGHSCTGHANLSMLMCLLLVHSHRFRCTHTRVLLQTHGHLPAPLAHMLMHSIPAPERTHMLVRARRHSPFLRVLVQRGAFFNSCDCKRQHTYCARAAAAHLIIRRHSGAQRAWHGGRQPRRHAGRAVAHRPEVAGAWPRCGASLERPLSGAMP